MTKAIVGLGAMLWLIGVDGGAVKAKRTSLSDATKALLFKGVCDLPSRAYGPRAIAQAAVVLEDARGVKYAAGHCRWCSPSSYVNDQLRDLLSRIKTTSQRRQSSQRASSSLPQLFRQVIGLSPGKRRNARLPFKTSPTVVRWFVKLLPPPQTAMCGATAQVVYDSGLREVARKTADALVFSLEAFDRVRLRELDRALTADDAHHDYLSKCRAFARRGRRHTDDVAADICLWWLRRAAVGDRLTVGRAVSQVLKTYDPSWWRANAPRLPKKLRR